MIQSPRIAIEQMPLGVRERGREREREEGVFLPPQSGGGGVGPSTPIPSAGPKHAGGRGKEPLLQPLLLMGRPWQAAGAQVQLSCADQAPCRGALRGRPWSGGPGGRKGGGAPGRPGGVEAALHGSSITVRPAGRPKLHRCVASGIPQDRRRPPARFCPQGGVEGSKVKGGVVGMDGPGARPTEGGRPSAAHLLLLHVPRAELSLRAPPHLLRFGARRGRHRRTGWTTSGLRKGTSGPF